MSLIKLLLISLLTTPSYASLYKCTDQDSEPVSVEESEKVLKIAYEKKDPYWIMEAQAKKYHKKKKPFLIYYAIDSAEPFMQYSIKYEVGQLEKNCQESENVNFAAVLNTLYVQKNEIIVCKDKVLKRVNLQSYPELDKVLSDKRLALTVGDHTTSDPGIFRYLVKYRPSVNSSFGEFPLAHPDFMYDLLNLLMQEKDLFPANRYMPFINLKSHGSRQTVLSGLHQCQIKAKTKTQTEIIGSKLAPSEVDQLNSFKTTQDVSLNVTAYDALLRKLYLGSSAGVFSEEGTLSGNFNLNGNFNLSGNFNLGHSQGFGSSISLGSPGTLGSSIIGLGAHEGLGSEQAFGLYHVNLNSVLDDLFNKANKRVLGFLMLESCDTNKDSAFQHTYMENILGFYSAKHSLWYRNLNWWTMLKQANGSTYRMVDIIEFTTKEIQNIQVLGPEP